jgi:hypothetical protein
MPAAMLLIPSYFLLFGIGFEIARMFDQVRKLPQRQRIGAYPLSSPCVANSRTALPIRFHSDIGRGSGFLLKA